MSLDSKNKVEWVHCNQCLRQTRHEVVATRVLTETEEVEDDSFTIAWTTTCTMLECRGCGSVTLRRQIVSHDVDVDKTDFYPPQIARQIPRWIYDLPSDFTPLVEEIYAALHANSKRLALMGARAVVDLFMNTTIGDIGGFQKKLEKLVEAGYLSKKNKEILEAALDAGHAAAHRSHNPSAEDVNLVFDIVENLIQTIAFKEKVEELKKHTPGRQVQTPVEDRKGPQTET